MFNWLVNDIHKLGTTKHSSQLVLKFLDSLGKRWEHKANFLKNNDKIKIMDLNTLFGNLNNYEETKALQKDIMKKSSKEKSIALFSRKEISVSDSKTSY